MTFLSNTGFNAAIRFGSAVSIALLAFFIQLGLTLALRDEFQTASYQVFLGATALCAVSLGRRPGLVTLALLGLIRLYFFLPPYRSVLLSSTEVIVEIVLFLGIGVVICVVGGALHASKERFATALTSIGDAVVTTDSRGTIDFMNPIAENLSGWRARHAIGADVTTVIRIVEGTHKQSEHPVRASLRQRATVRLSSEAVLLPRNGGPIAIEDSVSPIRGEALQPKGTVMVFRDVSERRKTDEALRESEARYRFLADAVPDFIFSSSALGACDYCNQRWYDYTGFTQVQSMGRGWFTAIHPNDAPQTITRWEESVRTGKDFQAEYRLRSKAGQYRWFLARGLPMRDQNGYIVKWFSVATDIEDFRRAEEQLHEARKMEAVGRLAGGVAHDFNNLLTIITGYGSALRDRADPRSEAWQEADEILRAAARASSLTGQLLTFGRRQVIKPEVVDLNVIVVETESMLRRLIGEDIALKTELDTALRPVRVDTGQMGQVIINLALNARDAMPGGGELAIQTKNVKLDGPYLQGESLIPPGRYVLLVLSDTGSGMDSETQSRIFEPFFTTKGLGKGTGLGLSTVYGIIRQSGGFTLVESELARGTTFRIYLPVVDEEITHQLEESRAPISAAGNETILVIEDAESLSRLIRTGLSRYGYEVIGAPTPEEALQLLGNQGRKVDLLLTDVVMPGMNGRVLAEAAMRTRPKLKVLYMSGYTDDVIARQGIVDPDVALIVKPFSIDSLAAKIRERLDG